MNEQDRKILQSARDMPPPPPSPIWKDWKSEPLQVVDVRFHWWVRLWFRFRFGRIAQWFMA